MGAICAGQPEEARRAMQTHILSNWRISLNMSSGAVHPGGIATELARHMPDGAMEAWVQQIQEQRAAAGEPRFEFKSIPQGAATSVWAGVVASAEEVGGKYCEDCHVGELIAAESQVSVIAKGVRGYALDPEKAKALWRRAKRWFEQMSAEDFQAAPPFSRPYGDESAAISKAASPACRAATHAHG
jgi:hypothetical protein